jgi:hypothetical protein
MQGTLQDFGLAEILQLVGMQHKTGLLRVENADKLLTLYFESGKLISVRDRRRIADDPLLEYLKRTGWLDAWQVLHLKLEAEEGHKDFGELLIEKNILSADELHGVLEDLAQDLVSRSYNWTEGTYRFVSGEESLRGLTHRISMNTEGLLLEAARRADEGPGLVTKISGPTVLLDAVTSLPNWLDERAAGVLARVKTPMRFGELAACARVPEFEVYEIVAAALDAGLTRILDAPPPSAVQETHAQPSTRPRPVASIPLPAPPVRHKPRVTFHPPRAFADVRPALVVAGTLCVCALLTLSTLFRAVRSSPSDAALATEEARAAIVSDLEMYRALVGRYPESLDDLSSAQIAAPDLQARAGVSGYAAVAHGETYRMRFTSDARGKPLAK